VGTFLSSGIDSAIITALSSKIHPGIKAFTVAFGVKDYSEIDDASAISRHLDVEHIKVIRGVEDFKEAFDFTDGLIGEGCVYETAGSLCGGKRVFLLAKMPEKKILEEKFDPYICFTNTHDGSGAIKAIMTPVRVVCQNTLSLAIQGATRAWSTRHLGDMNSKLAEAKYTLKMANDYMDKFAVAADQLANTTITEDQAMKVVDELFPVTADMSDRQARNMVDKKEDFMVCMFAPDILKFKGTAYQMVQAASDFATHVAPKRKTSTYQERNFSSILDGNIIIDTTFLKMMDLVKKTH
jgi:phage/plasmid-like protein (TIGR03299 family)